MLRTTLLLISILLLIVSTVHSETEVPAVTCGLSIYQWDSRQQGEVLLFADTVDFLKGVEATGFLTALSINLEVTEVEDTTASFILHVHTHAPEPSNHSRLFEVEYGLPARLRDIPGKGGAQYSLQVTPIAPTVVDTAYCSYQHTTAEDFIIDPSANFDIYFVRATLGDFYWNSVKGMINDEYKRLDQLLNFNLPGKYNLYLCPCRMHSVIWDDRFGMMVDPTRSTMFTIYSKSFNSAYPFVAFQAAILRNYGYAPAFLSEGFANYLSLAVHGMKKLIREGGTIPLDSLLDTYSYFQAEPVLADRISATFVRYLIEQYHSDRFLEFYRKADDLNLRNTLEETYGKTVAELESEWLEFVDTVAVKYDQYRYYRDQAETMRDYIVAVEYAHEMLKLASNPRDTLNALSELVRSSFFVGDYYGAIDAQQQYLEKKDSDARGWMSLAAYRMMNGEYDHASEDLQRAYDLDTTNMLTRFNLAFNSLLRGDSTDARERLYALVMDPSAVQGDVGSRVLLADLLLHSSDSEDQKQAGEYFFQVVNLISKQNVQRYPSPIQAMWLGIANLGAGNTGDAYDVLQLAMLLETRPFYEGMIELWLGKAADLNGDRAVAENHYSQVLSSASSYYHQAEARKYLETPYRQ